MPDAWPAGLACMWRMYFSTRADAIRALAKARSHPLLPTRLKPKRVYYYGCGYWHLSLRRKRAP